MRTRGYGALPGKSPLWWLVVLLLPGIVRNSLAADFWPQFHGPRRDNRSTETGLLKRWPTDGPELIWKARGIGHGFSTVAITDGKIYTAGNIDSDTIITAMDMSGRQLWQAKNGPAYKRSYAGSRSTPTVVAGRLYHLNGDGDVACLDAKTGRIVWTVNILEKFNGRNITWGLSESLLVEGNKVICSPGGEDICVVALDKDRGETIWTCRGVGDKPGYCAPIVIDYQGLRQIVTLTAGSAIGVEPESGRLLWKHPLPVRYGVNITTPVYRDGHLAVFRTWGGGATLLRLKVRGQDCSVEQIWHTDELDNEHGGVVLVGEHLFGHADGNHRDPHWACLDWKTGETAYATAGLFSKKSGSLTSADGMLYMMSDEGAVGLVPADPGGVRITSQFQLPEGGEGPAWAHPVVCGGRLYIRHGDFLYAYDIRAETR